MTSIPTYFGRPIEPRIRPLVEAMNAEGVCHTLASCEGHRRWLGVRPAYVYFQASLAFAAALNRLVYDDLCRDYPTLNYPWHLRGMFNDQDHLCFSLSVPEMERDPGAFLTWLTWSRSDLDADFGTLRGLVQEALAKIRGKKKAPGRWLKVYVPDELYDRTEAIEALERDASASASSSGAAGEGGAA